MVVHSTGNPYNESFIDDKTRIRVFENVNDDELVWHRDLNDRQITVIEGKNWKLQMDDSFPIELKEKEIYEIPKMVYHRLLKGNGILKIEITEKEDK